jgi:hypothetical protein
VVLERNMAAKQSRELGHRSEFTVCDELFTFRTCEIDVYDLGAV